MVRFTKLNRQNVRPIPIVGGEKEDKRPIKGFDVVPELYANIFLSARKKSGKTTIIWHLLKNCATKDTTVIIFSSTVFKDAGWINIRKLLKKKDIKCLAYNSMKDEGMDRLETLVKQLEDEAQEREKDSDDESESEEEDPKIFSMFKESENESEEEPKKPRKNKYQSPEFIIVMDDLSTELRNPSYVSLLKKNRHFFLKTITSSQYCKDLKPEQRGQIDLWILPKGQTIQQLEVIHKDSQCRLDEDEFIKDYEVATMDTKKNKHNFFYFAPQLDEYRRNFSEKIIHDV